MSARGQNLGHYSQLSRAAPPPPAAPVPGQPLTYQQQREIRQERWATQARRVTDQVVKDWNIHVLTDEEYQTTLENTRKCLGFMGYCLWCLRQPNLPNRREVEDGYMEAQIKYHLLLWRSFRINALPDEILTNIFRLVIWATLGKHAGVMARLNISWACRRWREVVIGDPTVWNLIWIREPYPFDRALTFLDRAQNAPVDLRLDDYDKQNLTSAETSEFMNHLVLKAPTIRSLVISLQTWESAVAVLRKLAEAGEAGTTFNMARFEMHRNGSPVVQMSDSSLPRELSDPIALFGGQTNNVPLHLCLSGIYIDWDRSVLRNLTCLDIRKLAIDRCPSLPRLREILLESPNLNKICLDGAGPRTDSEEARRFKPIHLPKLRSLVLADMQPVYASLILGLFTAPRLIDLTLMSLINQQYAPFFNLLAGRFPLLRILTLFTVKVNQSVIDAVFNLLISVPLLKYLRMAECTPLFLEVLCYDGKTKGRHFPMTQDAVICPQLDILEFHFLGSPETIQEWFNIVRGWQKHRSEIGVPLQKIWIPDDHYDRFSVEQREDLNTIAPLYIFHKATNSIDDLQITAEHA